MAKNPVFSKEVTAVAKSTATPRQLPLKQIIGSTNGFVVSNTSQQLLPKNRQRAYLMIQNRSAAAIYVAFNSSIDVNNFNAIEIASGGFYEIAPSSNHVISSDVFIKGAVGSQNIAYTEGLYV